MALVREIISKLILLAGKENMKTRMGETEMSLTPLAGDPFGWDGRFRGRVLGIDAFGRKYAVA